jgi:hypothetical protein
LGHIGAFLIQTLFNFPHFHNGNSNEKEGMMESKSATIHHPSMASFKDLIHTCHFKDLDLSFLNYLMLWIPTTRVGLHKKMINEQT